MVWLNHWESNRTVSKHLIPDPFDHWILLNNCFIAPLHAVGRGAYIRFCFLAKKGGHQGCNERPHVHHDLPGLLGLLWVTSFLFFTRFFLGSILILGIWACSRNLLFFVIFYRQSSTLLWELWYRCQHFALTKLNQFLSLHKMCGEDDTGNHYKKVSNLSGWPFKNGFSI